MVGFSIAPTAVEGIQTHLLCVSLGSFLKETVSKMCLFEIGQYHLALLNNSPQKEACEHLFEGLLVLIRHLLMREKPRELFWNSILWASISRPISSSF